MTLPSLHTMKTGAMGLGLIVGLFGMALALRWLVWVAMALLGVAFLLRFFQRPKADASEL